MGSQSNMTEQLNHPHYLRTFILFNSVKILCLFNSFYPKYLSKPNQTQPSQWTEVPLFTGALMALGFIHLSIDPLNHLNIHSTELGPEGGSYFLHLQDCTWEYCHNIEISIMRWLPKKSLFKHPSHIQYSVCLYLMKHKLVQINYKVKLQTNLAQRCCVS